MNEFGGMYIVYVYITIYKITYIWNIAVIK